MPNKIYRDRIINQINYAVKEAKNASEVDHQGLTGKIRELSASCIFAPLLPAGFEIGTGKICDEKGEVSDETDVIIYNRSILPPVLYSDRDGVFPIESCFYSIEVKSKATASEIQDAIRKGSQLLSLYYASASKDTDQNLSLAVLALFAFDSDLSETGISELERYAKYDSQWNTAPILKAICIVGKGYWYHNQINNSWFFHSPTQSYDEVVDFTSGITNTLILASTKPRKAMLGHYLMLERAATQIKF
jgi:hypothetical protein